MNIVILALATWRISAMLVDEDGPQYIFERFRHFIGVRRSPENPQERYAEDDGGAASLFLCVWCMSVWVGLFWTVLHMFHEFFAFILALPFALSAVSCLIEDLRWR